MSGRKVDTNRKKDLSWLWLVVIVMIILLGHAMLELERNRRHELEVTNRILMENMSYMQDEIERLRALVK